MSGPDQAQVGAREQEDGADAADDGTGRVSPRTAGEEEVVPRLVLLNRNHDLADAPADEDQGQEPEDQPHPQPRFIAGDECHQRDDGGDATDQLRA